LNFKDFSSVDKRKEKPNESQGEDSGLEFIVPVTQSK